MRRFILLAGCVAIVSIMPPDMVVPDAAAMDQRGHKMLRHSMTVLSGNGATPLAFKDEYQWLCGYDEELGLWLSVYYPWLAVEFKEIWDKVSSQNAKGAGTGGITALGGGTRGGPQKPITLSNLEFYYVPYPDWPTPVYLLATASWEAGLDLPNDTVDVFATSSLTGPWHYFGSDNCVGYLGPQKRGILVDLRKMGWKNSAFVKVGSKHDSDGDGLTDMFEILVSKTDPNKYSTADNGIGDGWKIQHGIDPFDPFCGSDDPDGDGLTNFDEYRYCTDPMNPDTDGDGVLDGDEIPHSPGSNPNDPDDNGDPANCVTLWLTVGDPSGSNSERWELHVFDAQGKLVIRHCDVGFGIPGTATYALTKGKRYTFKLKWAGTTLGDYPDYDWCCLINEATDTGLCQGLYDTGPFIVEDPDGLLTFETHGDDENITLGKEGTIIVPGAMPSEVRFHNTTPMKRDNGTDFPTAYHWKGGTVATGLGDESNPVAYVRGASPVISAKLKVMPADWLQKKYASVRVKATGPDGISVPPTSLVVTNVILDIAHISQVTCTGKLSPDAIKYYDKTGKEAQPFQLNWSISFDSGSTWHYAGNTKHTVYVTAAAAQGALRQETLFYHGCKYADGKSSTSTMISEIWKPFAARDVKRVDGTQLTYYKTSYDASVFSGSTSGLLALGDNKCGAWARFFLDILLVQGFRQDNNLAVIVPPNEDDHYGFIVKNWTFTGSGTSGSSAYPYMNRVAPQAPYVGTNGYLWVGAPEVDYTSGTAGQGNGKPSALFINHALAVVNGVYYDPSYGVTYPNLQGFDDMLDGFCRMYESWTANGETSPALLFRKNPAGCDVKERQAGRTNYNGTN